MSPNSLPVLDRALHQQLPNPLSRLYWKTCNSDTAKELHDNACHFGLCLLHMIAVQAVAVWRDRRASIGPEEQDVLAKMRRPSHGTWLNLLTRALVRLREQNLPVDSFASRFIGYVQDKQTAKNSGIAGSLGHLLSFLEKKPVVRTQASVQEFLEVLVRYRNETIGHGAVLLEDLNEANGAAVLKGTEEIFRSVPFWAEGDLKYVSQVNLDTNSAVCRFVNLMGPDWLRDPPVSYPRGELSLSPSHVVVLPKTAGEPTLDLHPLIVFHKECVAFFNGFKGRAPTYLDYASATIFRIDNLAQDYLDWESSLGAAPAPSDSGTGTSDPLLSQDTAPSIAALSSPRRFSQDRLLGRGGMGEVWLAYDQVLKRNVALKRIRAELLGQEEAHRRFIQEARSVARLSHVNIVPILTIDSDEEGPYLVLEYLEGGSLRQRLKSGPLPVQEALAYLRQMLQALDHAHEQGVIHRDVKPENILLTRGGLPKLADFGLAWVLQQEAGDSPLAGTREGTRNYLAPELAEDDAPNPRTDLYALGITFYEMLTGLAASPVRENKVPSTIHPLLRKMIYANPNLRFASARECLSECLELERSLELAARSDEETRERIERTLDQAYRLLGEHKAIDARAALERVSAEDPTNARAATGLLLVHLLSGDMPECAARYRALCAANSQDETFGRIRRFFEGIERPTVLEITPRTVPFSYLITNLQQKSFVKDLIEYSPRTLNLGDVGELLVELLQQSPGADGITYDCVEKTTHRLCLQFDRMRIEAEYRYRLGAMSLFKPRALLGIHARLSIDAEPFETYRLIRYLTRRLAATYKREPEGWLDRSQAAHFGWDPKTAEAIWRHFCGDLLQIARGTEISMHPPEGSL